MLACADFEIEEHVLETNRFFQMSGFTLDDLNVYAEPLAAVCRAVRSAANGNATKQDLMTAVWEAARKYRAIDDRLTAVNEQAVA
jgi:hypothetical protein